MKHKISKLLGLTMGRRRGLTAGLSAALATGMTMVSFGLGVASLASPAAYACEGAGAEHAQSSTPHHEPSLTLQDANQQRAVFQVKGIMCKSCEKKIQAALRKVKGVKAVTFLKAGSKDGVRLAQVTFEAGNAASTASLAQAVAGAGFKATLTQ